MEKLDLSKKNLEDLPQLKEVYSIDQSKSLREVLQKLVAKKVYSLAVFDNEDFKGVISLESVIQVIVGLFAAKSKAAQNAPAAQRIANHKYTKKEITDITYEFNHKTIKESNCIVFTKLVSPKTTISEAIKGILLTKVRLVVGEGNKVSNIVSPFLIIKYLAKFEHLTVHSKKLAESKAKVTTPVETVNGNVATIATFATMIEKGFSGIGILDNGKILSIATLKDIKRASTDFSTLLEPVEEYIKQVRQSVISTTMYPTINVASDELVGNVIKKCIAIKSHRVFVRDTNDKLNGIISVSDVLAAYV